MTEVIMASIVGVVSGYYIFNDIVEQVSNKEERAHNAPATANPTTTENATSGEGET